MGEPVTPDNLESLLRRCAENLPGDHKPDSHSWGVGACGELLKDLSGTPLHDSALDILESFLVHGDADEARLADLFFAPDRVSLGAVEAAFNRADLDAELHDRMRANLGMVLARKPALYTPKWRQEVRKSGWEYLLGAILVADHAWFLANVHALLGATATDAANTLYYGLKQLRQAEADELKKELDAQRAQLGDAYVSELIACIDGESYRPGAKRW